jgi:polygalacturonase
METDRPTGTDWVLMEALPSEDHILFILYVLLCPKMTSHLPFLSRYRPDHFVVVKHSTNLTIKDLNIKNWPVHCFDITDNEGVTITGLNLDNSDGDTPNAASSGLPAAHNSDGFDISSSDYVTLDNIYVRNQDDCVAVTSGTHVTVNNMYCDGGHGLSIGSIGGKSNNTVDNITFSNSHVINSSNGCRIKTNSGKTGTVRSSLSPFSSFPAPLLILFPPAMDR